MSDALTFVRAAKASLELAEAELVDVGDPTPPPDPDPPAPDPDPPTPDPEPEPDPDPPAPSGHNPARFNPDDHPLIHVASDPELTDRKFRGTYQTTGRRFRCTLLGTDHTENPAVTTTNNVAGNDYTDPLVHRGHSTRPMRHLHTFLGSIQPADADMVNPVIDDLWDPGSDADDAQKGYPDGFQSPIWWPAIFAPDGQEVDYKAGIPAYYVRRKWHRGHRVWMLPTGVGYVSFAIGNYEENSSDYRIRADGPSWFHENVHIGAFPERDPLYNAPWLSWGQNWPGPGWHACLQLQLPVKFRKPGGRTGLKLSDWRFGDPDGGIEWHIDYVSGWEDWREAQELADRSQNRDIDDNSRNIKFEAVRGL